MNQILQGVCMEYGIDREELMDGRLRGAVTEARHVAILRLHEANSIRETARMLNINPGTVVYHVNTAIKQRSAKVSVNDDDELAWAHEITGEDDCTHQHKFSAVSTIQREVCAFYGITIHHMLSQSRMTEFIRPRQIAVYLCHQLARKTLVEMGGDFHRDHSTLVHSIRKIEAAVREGGPIADDVALLKRRLSR